jgi:DNA-binding beta-propeller fold protein YncE
LNPHRTRSLSRLYLALGLILDLRITGCRSVNPSVVADAQIPLASGLGSPQGIAISNQGIIYVADTANNRVVTISNAGVVNAVNAPGLSSPGGVAVDAAGDLYIADSNNARVLKIPFGGTPVPVPVPGGSLKNGDTIAHTLPTNAAHPTDMKSVVLAKHPPDCRPHASKTHKAHAC